MFVPLTMSIEMDLMKSRVKVRIARYKRRINAVPKKESARFMRVHRFGSKKLMLLIFIASTPIAVQQHLQKIAASKTGSAAHTRVMKASYSETCPGISAAPRGSVTHKTMIHAVLQKRHATRSAAIRGMPGKLIRRPLCVQAKCV
jgi:hypothetical protein